MKTTATAVVVALAIGFLWWAGYRNVNETKAAATKVWRDAGYEILGYEGYQWAPLHGSAVWYIVRRTDENRVTYHGYLAKWGDEHHIYKLRAIDAIKP